MFSHNDSTGPPGLPSNAIGRPLSNSKVRRFVAGARQVSVICENNQYTVLRSNKSGVLRICQSYA